MRYLFPTDGQRIIFAWDAGGYLHTRAGLRVVVYLDQACTTEALDLQTPDGTEHPEPPVVTIPGSDPARIPRFMGPDGVTELYLRAEGASGAPFPLSASNTQRVAALESALATVQAQLAALAPLTPQVLGDIMGYLPAAAATASGLSALKRLVVNNIITVTAATAAAVGQGYEIGSASTASVAIAAPSTGLQVGDTFMVGVAAGFTFTATVTSSVTFAGQASPFTMVPGQQQLFEYDGTQWIVG